MVVHGALGMSTGMSKMLNILERYVHVLRSYSTAVPHGTTYYIQCVS